MAETKSRENRRVMIVHDRVGQWNRGEVVDASELNDAQGLVDMGAVRYVDANTPAENQPPTLHQMIHSESPPTLPNTGPVSAEPRDVQIAAGLLPPEHGNVGPGGVGYVGPDELRNPPKR